MEAQDKLNQLYNERDRLVALISSIYPSHLAIDEEAEEGFKYVVYVQTPEGQLSWHIADEELVLFGHLKVKDNNCDGECPDKGRTFEMVKAIKNKCGNLIPASHIEELINKHNMGPEDLILTIENYCEPFNDKTINKIMKRITEQFPMFDL